MYVLNLVFILFTWMTKMQLIQNDTKSRRKVMTIIPCL